MSASQEIIKTALLGTDKYTPVMDPSLHELSLKLQVDDKEKYFLRLANAVFLYEEAGQECHRIEKQFPVAWTETKTTISASNKGLLLSFLRSNDELMLHYLTFLCNQHQQVVDAELIPDLLKLASEQKRNSLLYTQACGATGQWLCTLNPDWQHLSVRIEEEAWEQGNFQTRFEYLNKLRASKSKDIIPFMQVMFDEENAANRLLLLELLQTNLSSSDQHFLQSLQKDKSQKIKERAINLLIQIPGSDINTQCIHALNNLLSIKEERYLLISKKKKILINKEATLSDDLFKSGIEKVCSIKGVHDHAFWAIQLLALLPPLQTAAALQCSESELLDLLLNETEFKQLMPFIHQCAIRFKQTEWASKLIRNSSAPDIQLLDCIPQAEQAEYYLYYIEQHHLALFEYIIDESYTEIKHSLAVKIIDRLEKDPYVNSNNLYPRLALRLPPSMTDVLRKKSEEDKDEYQYRYFKNQLLEMLRILEIKQTIKF